MLEPNFLVDEGLCAACTAHSLPRPFFSHKGPWLPVRGQWGFSTGPTWTQAPVCPALSPQRAWEMA